MPIYSARYNSPNFGYPKGSSGRRGQEIIGVCVHISGAEWNSNYNWIMNPAANASYNAIIRRDGSIIKLVPEANAAYSHGRINSPTWPLLKSGVNPNLYTLSVARVGSNQNTWDKPQMESIVNLVKYWANKYKFKPEWPYVFGHKHIDSVNRWYCPGDPFLSALYKELEKITDIPELEPDISYRVIVASNDTYSKSEAARNQIQKLFPAQTPWIALNEVNGGLWYRVVFDEVETIEQARTVVGAASKKWDGSVWFVREWEDLDYDVPKPVEPEPEPSPEPEPEPEPNPEPIETKPEPPEEPELPSGLMELLKRIYELLKKIFGG